MDLNPFLQNGRIDEALAVLKETVRLRPVAVEPRALLFALNCVLGRYDKASADLETIKSLDAGWVPAAAVYRSLIEAERRRTDTFAGREIPLILGEPDPWLAWNVRSLALESQGEEAEALELRSRAWDAAPEHRCRIDGAAYPWLCDTDRRLGPVLEAVMGGKYYWMPFGRLVRVEIQPVEFLVELVWVPATIVVTGGAELRAHLPVRYPGTEALDDGQLRLAQRTDWPGPGAMPHPVGQKLFETEGADFGLLACRAIEFEP